MIISFKHKFIFMKTRKTAGSSIQAALSKVCGREDIITGSNYDLKTNILDESHIAGRNIDKFFTNHPHPLISDVKDFLGKNIWDSFFKFAFVRNPFDVAISRYFWNVKGKKQNTEECSVEGFRKWILTYCSDNAVFGPAEFYTNDLAHLYTCSGGYIDLDFIGKYENLNEDFKYILDKLNLSKLQLDFLKGGFRKSKNYKEYYDNTSKDLIEQKFKMDLDLFDYSFENKFSITKKHPIILPEMIDDENDNINGPCLMRAPEWLENPLGKYYLYFAHHQGKYIKMAYSNNIEGPYEIYEKGTLRLKDTPCKTHIASPDIYIDNENKEIRMYYHGDTDGGQYSFLSYSNDGIKFFTKLGNSDKKLGQFYFRVFKYRDKFYAVAKNKNIDGILYQSNDGEFDDFKEIFNFLPNVRHTSVYIKNDILYLFYTSIGDMPESIYVIKIQLSENVDEWDIIDVDRITKPQFNYEGSNEQLIPSQPGSSTLRYGGGVNEIRDPYIYEEDNKLYLLYSIAGEMGITISTLRINE